MFQMPDESIFGSQTNDNVELLKAWAGTTLAFAILRTGSSNLLTTAFVSNLLVSAVVCGLGFVLHELAHRVVARNYGAEAHFIANNGWLILSIVIAFAGFFIAAPGAVWHRGYLTARQGGLIALAGPATNMVLSLIFFIALLVVLIAQLAVPQIVFDICLIGFSLNAWLGLFNMIPAGPFDGAKVLNWSPLVFGVTVAIGLVLTFVLGSQTAIVSVLRLFRA
ncbi:MAG: peptidase M50 [Kouleothrix sp.]|jgi:Zn-dependent protease|nr:peptidase M50 [Kouleothrix sp.]